MTGPVITAVIPSLLFLIIKPDMHASPSLSMNPAASNMMEDAVDDHNHGRSHSILGINDKTNQDNVGAKADVAVQGEDCEIDDSTKSTVDHLLEPHADEGVLINLMQAAKQLEEQQDITFEDNKEMLEAIDDAINEVVEELHTAENIVMNNFSAVDTKEITASDGLEQSPLNDRDDNQDEVGENKPESDFVIDESQPCDKTNHGLDDKQDEVGQDMQGKDCQSDKLESDDQEVTLEGGNVQPLRPREGGSKDIYGAKRGCVDQLIRLIPQVNPVSHGPDLNSMNNKSIDSDDDISQSGDGVREALNRSHLQGPFGKVGIYGKDIGTERVKFRAYQSQEKWMEPGKLDAVPTRKRKRPLLDYQHQGLQQREWGKDTGDDDDRAVQGGGNQIDQEGNLGGNVQPLHHRDNGDNNDLYGAEDQEYANFEQHEANFDHHAVADIMLLLAAEVPPEPENNGQLEVMTFEQHGIYNNDGMISEAAAKTDHTTDQATTVDTFSVQLADYRQKRHQDFLNHVHNEGGMIHEEVNDSVVSETGYTCQICCEEKDPYCIIRCGHVCCIDCLIDNKRTQCPYCSLRYDPNPNRLPYRAEKKLFKKLYFS
jgi:hypothetical protein